MIAAVAPFVTSNRLRLFRNHLVPSFLSARRQRQSSVAPAPFDSLDLVVCFIFFPVVCATYSKHTIHLKLPNDFLLNASLRKEKKPNRKKECDFRTCYSRRFWASMAWHMRKWWHRRVHFPHMRRNRSGAEKNQNQLLCNAESGRKRDKRNISSGAHEKKIIFERSNYKSQDEIQRFILVSNDEKCPCKGNHRTLNPIPNGSDDIFHTN